MHDHGCFEMIPELLSEPRFQPFLDAYSGRRDLAMRLYAWNVELTTSFWGPMSVLEVILRNSIHDALRRGRRDDWWNAPEVRLLERERRHIDQAHRALVHRGQTEPTAGQVVAATSLGLWVGLTDAGIPRHPRVSYETALW